MNVYTADRTTPLTTHLLNALLRRHLQKTFCNGLTQQTRVRSPQQ